MPQLYLATRIITPKTKFLVEGEFLINQDGSGEDLVGKVKELKVTLGDWIKVTFENNPYIAPRIFKNGAFTFDKVRETPFISGELPPGYSFDYN